jgi:hypothetical protein
MNKDFMDFWSLERMRVDYPGQWGVAVNFMHEYQGRWDPVRLHRAMRAYFATVLLHDALPTGNNNGHARYLTDIRAKFGIGDRDVRFLPYWKKAGLAARSDDTRPAGWLKPEKLMLLVSNFGEERTAEVRIDTTRLGWGDAGIAVTDPERGYKRQDYRQREGKRERIVSWNGEQNPPLQLNGTRLRVPVARHNYRLLVIERKERTSRVREPSGPRTGTDRSFIQRASVQLLVFAFTS